MPSVKIKTPAQNQREINAKVMGLKPAPRRHVFWLDGDGATTDFALPPGWRPYAATVEGLDQRKGPGEAWDAEFSGFRWVVKFDVPPGLVSVGIHCESEV